MIDATTKFSVYLYPAPASILAFDNISTTITIKANEDPLISNKNEFPKIGKAETSAWGMIILLMAWAVPSPTEYAASICPASTELRADRIVSDRKAPAFKEKAVKA